MRASVIGFLDAVTAGQEPPVTGATALETLRLLERIYDTAAVLDSGSFPTADRTDGDG